MWLLVCLAIVVMVLWAIFRNDNLEPKKDPEKLWELPSAVKHFGSALDQLYLALNMLDVEAKNIEINLPSADFDRVKTALHLLQGKGKDEEMMIRSGILTFVRN